MTRITLLSVLVMLIGACTQAGANKNTLASDSVPAEKTGSVPAAGHPSSRPLTFAFVGDIMMGTTYPEDGNYLPPSDGANLFSEVKEILRGADIAAGNLEGTLLDGKGIVKKCGDPSLCYAFRMPVRYAAHLVDAGFDFVGIANNHVNDFGAPGLESTRNTLAESGIAYAGLRDGCQTAVLEREGRRIGFAAFGHSKGTLSIMDLDEVRRTVRSLRDSCDLVVVSFHGGGEGKAYTHVPHTMETCFGENRGDVEKFAHTAVDAGADVVYGHGPHVTRALELYKGHLIIYSLGNFCTPYRMSLSGISSHAPVVTVTLAGDGTFMSGRIHSFTQAAGTGPRADSTNVVARNMKSLSASDFPSSPLEIGDDGTLSRKGTAVK